MGGKSSSGPDTSGLEEATKQATALQERIYDETRADVQPWYQMGTGAVSKLSDLLGISGGSVQSRDDIYSSLMPQYQSTQTTQSGGGDFYVTPSGQVVTKDAAVSEMNQNAISSLHRAPAGADPSEYLARRGYKPQQTQQSSTTTDYDALNAAVEARMAEQAQTPEGFGSLLEKFDADKFEQDPGYQFRQDEANKALERSMAAQGVTLGGAGFGDINPSAYRAMEELNQGLASQEYGNAYNRYTQDQLNTFNMLMGASGQGQATTGQLAQSGQNYATNVGNLQTGLASAQLNADLQSQSSGGMFGSLLGAGAGALLGNPSFGAAIGGKLFG